MIRYLGIGILLWYWHLHLQFNGKWNAKRNGKTLIETHRIVLEKQKENFLLFLAFPFWVGFSVSIFFFSKKTKAKKIQHDPIKTNVFINISERFHSFIGSLVCDDAFVKLWEFSTFSIFRSFLFLVFVRVVGFTFGLRFSWNFCLSFNLIIQQ